MNVPANHKLEEGRVVELPTSQDSDVTLRRIRRPHADPNTATTVLAVSGRASSNDIRRLIREYELAEYLDGTWALQPLELIHQDDQTTLILQDPGGDLLSRLLHAPMDVDTFLRFAISITEAVGKMHQRGLVHKDIKPANILLDPDTEQVWLTGLGVASRLARERQAPNPPEIIAGTLAYMAPEQTGRMNRSIDSRSDLYSLGVTFYQMLTGTLPFSAHDPLEWVYCHIARTPIPPCRRLENIPPPISEIVMKLLAKTAEERYQTAAGVERDLRRCRDEWEARGAIDEFPLAEHDSADRLLIPEKLYGRGQDVAALIDTFQHVVATGVPELVLVSGYSGIGKSSVVNELHRALVPSRGFFAAGKFDQFKRDIPYATVAQAFQSLVRQILSKSEGELQNWREALGEALGSNGLLMVDLIPELELVIGKQPQVADLSPQDAQRRFQTVLRRFIAVFARPEHPLALFLDDLQWLDAATLDLLEDLLTQRDIRHLLLIGAYRDNEVDATHPLLHKLGAIRRAGVIVKDIVLAPLTYDDLEELIVDALHCGTRPANPLVQLVHEKTGGNPFFAIQFLYDLADEALLVFDHADARWFFDLGRIHRKRYTDNVVDLMVVKLNRLPAETQAALCQLASVGASATFDLLGMVCQTSPQALHDKLWEAVRSGLVLNSGNSYAFQHDRIQEAAYALIPTEQRAAMHLRIGEMLVAHTPPDKLEEAIFEIVNQLNRASSLVTAPEKREQLAAFNLVAGRRALASSAYLSALNYLTTGAALLTEDSWRQHRELCFGLDLAKAHCEFASGLTTEAEERLRRLSIRAVSTGERVAVACLQVDLYQGIDRSDEAVAVGLRTLRHLGVDLPERPTEADARCAYNDIWTRLGDRSIEDLALLPLMSDRDSLAALDLLIRVAVPGHFVSFHIFVVAVCTAVSLGLEWGHSDASCIAYVQLGTLAGPHFGEFDAGYRFGQLGCELVQRPGLQRFQARAFETFGFLIPWTQHVRKGREFLYRGFDLASRIGEISYAGYACGQLNTNYLIAGDPLIEAQEQAEYGLAYARKVGFGAIEGWIRGQLGLIRSLRGLTVRPGCFDDASFLELDFERDLAADPALALTECWYYIRKLQARFLAGEYADALQAASRAQPMLWNTVSLLEIVEYHFYDALCHAAVYESASFVDREHHRAVLIGHLEKLDTWALHCPENFANRAALIGAEVARIEGRDTDAGHLYEKAIRSARANGFVHNEALACETVARFYAARGFEDIAEMYLTRAHDRYLRWRADGKVRQLESRYPQLLRTEPHHANSEPPPPVQQLDTAVVVKASQALSSEMLLPRLIDRLMTIALQNAGAVRGLLILPHEGDYRIEAEARADGETIVLHYGALAGQAVPESIIRYVMRTQGSVILDDAAKPNLFSEDSYFAVRRQRSILCLPLVRQGALVGLLYLENALAPQVFTPDRARLLELLGSQAAISLENTRLYSDLTTANEELKKEIAERTRTQEALSLRDLQLRLLVDSIAAPVALMTATGEVDVVNSSVLDYFGKTLEELKRWSTIEAVHPDDLPHAIAAWAAAIESGQPYEIESRHRRADGVYRWFHVRGFPIRDPDGQLVRWCVLQTDIDDRKKAEAAARESELRYRNVQMELAHANRVATTGELTASIAHEVNQPIAASITNAETAIRWLVRQPPDVERAMQVMGRVVADVRRAADIVGRIRAFVKKEPAQKDALELNKAILEVVELTRVKLSDHGVVLHTQLAQGLMPIQGDRVQLQQVMMNLIMNAIEAMSEVKERARELLIRTREVETGGVLVAVSDTGPGLPEAKPDRLFEAFYTTKPSGLGMGLSICRSIVEAHGGRLWAVPNEPHGAVFCMLFPIEEKAVGTLEPSRQ